MEQGLRRGGLTLALVQHFHGNIGGACTAVETSCHSSTYRQGFKSRSYSGFRFG